MFFYQILEFVCLFVLSVQERAYYLEYQKLVREIEHLSRFCVAYQFVLAEEMKVSSTEMLNEMQSNVEKFQESRAEIQEKVKQLNEDIAEMEKEKDKVNENRLVLIWIPEYKEF